MSDQVEHIDIARTINRKLGVRLSKPVAGFIAWFIKQKEINRYLDRIGPCSGVEFMQRALAALNVTISVHGLENLPPSGTRCMFVCNHPLGGVDVLAAVAAVGPHYPEGLKIPANDFLLALHGIRDMLIPVNKMGGQRKELSEKIHSAFESDSQLMFFPAGKVSRKNKGVIRDDVWQKNFLTKSVETRRVVVPIHIEAANSKLFYNISKIRNKLHVHFNVEMLMLPRELFKQRGKSLQLTIGKPIDYSVFDESKTPLQWAQEVRRLVYQLE